ncbi:MAG: long-chain-fatty-acid--CoA ligase [Actinobacteria bacterium]|nr:long-chain-fatty-acid--CoA ligase [Actinomycetota bacterium]
MSEIGSLERNLLRRACIGDIPMRTAAKYPQKTAIVWQGKRITYKEYNENVCRCANSFLEMGIARGDRIAFMTHNALQYIYAWLGLAKIGAVCTPLNFMLKGPEIEYLINHAEPRAFFVEDSLIPEVEAVKDKLASVETFGYIRVLGDGDPPEGWLNIDDLFSEDKDASEPEVEVDDEDPATLLYTSGTEARPKGVMNTHRNFYIIMTSGVADLNFKKDDVFLLSIPLYHVAAKYLLLVGGNVGATMVLEYAPNPPEILELTEKEKVTYWVYPPTLFQVLPSMPDFDKCDLSSLEKCIAFGSVMPPALLETWKKILPQAEWRNYYGQTESSPLGSNLQPEDFERKIDSIGKSHTGLLIKIFDDGGNEVPTGEVGEIVMRGPSVMKGYYKDEGKTAETLMGGWLHTGDLGRFDEEGFLYFVDRKKDIIKSGGENVSSQEVEGALFKHEKVMQAAVIGLQDDHWGEAVTAIVVPKPGAELVEDELLAYCKECLAAFKVPKKVFIIAQGEMPVNPSGKILKRELRGKFSG